MVSYTGGSLGLRQTTVRDRWRCGFCSCRYELVVNGYVVLNAGVTGPEILG